MWYIVGTAPEADAPLHCGGFDVDDHMLRLHGSCPDGASPSSASSALRGALSAQGGPRSLPVQRGTPALAAAAWLCCRRLGVEPPRLLLAGDTGRGDGSRAVYGHLVEHAAAMALTGLTFHYLFPDVDWHNRVLMAVQALEPRPLLVADAGFMYVAKMSGYADAYDLFTPDAGEMAFLADEKAPHPFYTRGFLLENDDVPSLVRRAREHGNVPSHLLVKGAADYIADAAGRAVLVDAPSVPAMEAIGGTGDLVTGLVTGFLAAGLPLFQACLMAAKTNRRLAALAAPTPATQVAELLPHLPDAVGMAATA